MATRSYVIVPTLLLMLAAYVYTRRSRNEHEEAEEDTAASVNSMVGSNVALRRVASDQSDHGVLRYAAVDAAVSSRPLTTLQFMELLSRDTPTSRNMVKDLTTIIQDCPYRGVFFETMGVDSNSVSTTPFEFVLVNAPSLARVAESAPDRHAFSEYLDCDGGEMTCRAFDNTRGDARLIAPRMSPDVCDAKVYSHLAAFMRGAGEEQIYQLWHTAAKEHLRKVKQRGEGERTWFSTSGRGTAWLHVRSDSYPKHYQYRPFKNVLVGKSLNLTD